MNASVKALAVKLFGVAEHEVDDLCKGLVSLFEHGGGQTPTAAAGPSQEDFDALKGTVEDQAKEIATLQQTIDDLTKPDASASSADPVSDDAPQS